MVLKTVCLMVIGLIGLICSSHSSGLQSPTKERRAVLAIDVNMERLRSSGLEQVLQEAQAGGAQNEVQSILLFSKRITGALSAPESLQSIMTLAPGEPVPLDFFLKLQFADADAQAKTIANLQEGLEEVTEGGRKRFKPTSGGPTNIRLVVIDATTIEFGTLNYLDRPDRLVNTPALNNVWKSMPDHAIRLAIDFDGARRLLDDAGKMLAEQAQPQFKPFVEMLAQMASLKLSVDATDTNLVALGITGRDEKTAEDLHVTLDGFLNMAKFMMGAQVAELKKESPKVGEVLGVILTSLRAVKNGTLVTVEIPRPAGLEVAIKEGIEKAQIAASEVGNMNRFKQAALAVHNYHDAYNRMPFSFVGDQFESGDLSWRVRVLPYIEEMSLYEEIDKKSAWDNLANKPFSNRMPEAFGIDSNSLSDIAWVKTSKLITSFHDITDGTSNTIMFVQNPAGIPWMRKNDLTVDETLAMFKELPADKSLVVALFDGSVLKLGSNVTQDQLRSLLEPADGK